MTPLAALLTIVTPMVFAQPVQTIGVGTHSCGQYLEYTTGRQADTYKQLYRQWVWGFMSGHNSGNAMQQSKLADDATIIAFLNNFCQRNPSLTVSSGAWALVAEAGGKPVQFQYEK